MCDSLFIINVKINRYLKIICDRFLIPHPINDPGPTRTRTNASALKRGSILYTITSNSFVSYTIDRWEMKKDPNVPLPFPLKYILFAIYYLYNVSRRRT